MNERSLLVLDSSVGVKWAKPEQGSDEALELLARHCRGINSIVVSDHFLNEVMSVAVRHGGVTLGSDIWSQLSAAKLITFRLDMRLASAALAQCELLGCSFYDALAPALADELGAELWSADARAHARYEGVRLLG